MIRDVQRTRRLLRALGNRGALSILVHLQPEDARFSELLVAVGVNKQTLTCRLSELQRHGLIVRTAFPEVPPRVEYHLTSLGRRVLTVLQALDERGFGAAPPPEGPTDPAGGT